jgi:hypothetical protein
MFSPDVGIFQPKDYALQFYRCGIDGELIAAV